MKKLLRFLPFMIVAENLGAPVTSKPARAVTNTKSKDRPFSKEPGVIKYLEDYREILSGSSKKSGRKQSQIINKVNAWRAQGLLTKKDLL